MVMQVDIQYEQDEHMVQYKLVFNRRLEQQLDKQLQQLVLNMVHILGMHLH